MKAVPCRTFKYIDLLSCPMDPISQLGYCKRSCIVDRYLGHCSTLLRKFVIIIAETICKFCLIGNIQSLELFFTIIIINLKLLLHARNAVNTI